jgi:hypothetical protein
MPRKRRASKHRGALNQYESAWLEGDRKVGGFIQFKADEELQELWDRAGDHQTMYWQPGMSFPVPIDEMEDAE